MDDRPNPPKAEMNGNPSNEFLPDRVFYTRKQGSYGSGPDSGNWRSVAAFGLFWSWNLIFLAFMVLGFAPRVLPEIITAVSGDLIPFSFLVYGLILSAIPLATIVLGATVLTRQPYRLFALGYVVEGPLMLLLAIRFFIIREATPAVTLVILVACLGMAAFLWYTLDRGGN